MYVSKRVMRLSPVSTALVDVEGSAARMPICRGIVNEAAYVRERLNDSRLEAGGRRRSMPERVTRMWRFIMFISEPPLDVRPNRPTRKSTSTLARWSIPQRAARERAINFRTRESGLTLTPANWRKKRGEESTASSKLPGARSTITRSGTRWIQFHQQFD